MLSYTCLNEFSEFEGDQYAPAEEHFKEKECYEDFENPEYVAPTFEMKNCYGEYESEQADVEESENWKVIPSKVSGTKKIKKQKAAPIEVFKKRHMQMERQDTMVHSMRKLSIHEHKSIAMEDEKEVCDGFKRLSIHTQRGSFTMN